MIKPNFHRKEAPVAAVVGSVIGSYVGGGAIGSVIGSVVGGMIGNTLLGGSQPGYPTTAMPGSPGATAMPGSTAAPGTDLNNPAAGSGSAATTSDINKGASSMTRRGRLSTILSGQQLAGDDTEKLGG